MLLFPPLPQTKHAEVTGHQPPATSHQRGGGAPSWTWREERWSRKGILGVVRVLEKGTAGQVSILGKAHRGQDGQGSREPGWRVLWTRPQVALNSRLLDIPKPCNPAIHFSVYTLDEALLVCPRTYTRNVHSGIANMENHWKQTRCPSAAEWTAATVYSHSGALHRGEQE